MAGAIGLALYLVGGSGFTEVGEGADKVRQLQDWVAVAAAVVGLGFVASVGALLTRQRRVTDLRHEQRLAQELEEVRQRQSKSKGSMAATSESWELARVKLEAYLNRNLDQVRIIFWVSLIMMGLGFGLIGFGALMVIQGKVEAAMVGSASGVLVEFIGASVLKLYMSIMSQARSNVRVLERINAVGMAVRILDGVDNTPNELKQRALVNVSRSLLAMYGELGDQAEEAPAPSVTDQIAAS